MLLMDMIIVIISFFMIMVMKMTKKYAHNMTLMSKYEELLLDEKRPKHLGKALPPPRHYICRDRCNQCSSGM